MWYITSILLQYLRWKRRAFAYRFTLLHKICPEKCKIFGLRKEICWDFSFFLLKWDIWSTWPNCKVTVTLNLTRILPTSGRYMEMIARFRIQYLLWRWVVKVLCSHKIPAQNFLVSHNIPIIWLRKKALRKIWNLIHSR